MNDGKMFSEGRLYLSFPSASIGNPLYTKLPMEEEHNFNFPLIKRQELLKLFLQNNVVAYLSAHTHKAVIHSCEKIRPVSDETTSKNFDKQPFGFRLW